ncbi:hypothetical protein PSTT_04068 [Puccinia striiformis]|uniref:BED-type domain-containing protein n=1 Tax=Puccinia striiformis TaxID=27350 RepID=A0A2S4VU87_9BASI|nr:hypothetical protein PSTT_04068 [Puccinia striiformis]
MALRTSALGQLSALLQHSPLKHTSSTEKPTNPSQITALANIQPSGTHASPLELFLLKNFLVSEDDKDDVKIYKQEVILLSKVNKITNLCNGPKQEEKAPPPHASPPADPPPELQAAGSDIEVNETERQSDIVMATPSISQATTGQPTKNEYDHPSKKREATSNHATGKCRYCQRLMDTKTTNGTTSLWRHLGQCADYLSSQRQTLISVKQTSEGTRLTWGFSQKASRELLTRMIIAHEHPFALLKQPLFRAFVASSQPKFKLLSCGTLKTDIIALYESLKSKLATEIAKANQISLTTDLWTSSNQTPFMVVTSHYITNYPQEASSGFQGAPRASHWGQHC